jgi:osmoprotectant transport system ATP-binding protein
MISINGVSKYFGAKAAVNELSVEVGEGEHMALLGASGSGKTTLLRTINRLIDPTHGTIYIDGRDISTLPAHLLRRNIGFVLQANSLFPHFTVEENISVIPDLLKWDRSKTRNRVTELLEKMQLPDHYRARFPRELSGGEAQRVNLARALAADPPILLMDEPFSALDTITRTAVRQLFIELEDLKSKTIIMVTHDVQEAFEMGSTVALMQEGRIMQKGKPVELLYRPANEYVRSFLSNNYLLLALGTITVEQLWNWLKHSNSGEMTYTTWQGLLKAFIEFKKSSKQ